MFGNFFFLKLHQLRNNAEKHGTAREATDDNIIQRQQYAICILDN
jgi:hypothetical protein